MRIQVLLNDEPVCTAGLSGSGYLSAHLNTEVRRFERETKDVLRVVGIETHDAESVQLNWPSANVKEGDVVTLKLMADGPATEPASTRSSSAAPSNLCTNTALASRFLAVCASFETELGALLDESRAIEPPDEYAKLRRAFAEVAASLGEHILYPVYRNHASLVPPDLRGELL